jgi:glycerol-3-phosphate dehydrogenase
MVIALNEKEEKTIQMLYDRGITNGVKAEHMKILDGQAARSLEPKLNEKVMKVLICTNSFVIDSVAATQALLQSATNNNAEVFFNFKANDFKYENSMFDITSERGEKISAKIIVNAAGHYADVVADLAGYPDFKQTTRRGEYAIVDKKFGGNYFKHIIFLTPTIHGKGVIIANNLQNDLLIGPTSENNVPKEDTRLTTKGALRKIFKIGKKISPTIGQFKNKVSYHYAGSRPIISETDDFLIVLKKHGVAVQATDSEQDDLEKILKEKYKTPIFVLNRIDQPVTGLVIFGKKGY